MRFRSLAAALATSLVAASPAMAQPNLVTNGSFETPG